VLLPKHGILAVTTKPEPILVNPANAGSIVTGLRAGLPKGTWENMQRMAAAESVHYANAASIAVSGNDVQTLRHCIHALLGLARNFEAAEIEQLVTAIDENGSNGRNIATLLVLATEWHNSTKY
jgi:hypothetical protein